MYLGTKQARKKEGGGGVKRSQNDMVQTSNFKKRKKFEKRKNEF